MSALDPNDARRLRSSLARLASNHEGEVVAAASAASRILAKHGLGFADLAVAPDPTGCRDVLESAWGPRRRPHEARLLREHQRRAWLLQISGFAWNDWERGFLASIASWDNPISPKQAAHLRDLETAAAAWRASREAA